MERRIKDHISQTSKLGDLTPTVDGNYQFTVLKGKLDYYRATNEESILSSMVGNRNLFDIFKKIVHILL